MSAGQRGRCPPVLIPEIVWIVRDRNTEYGMFGSIKAFSIHDAGMGIRLDPRLPNRKGITYPSEEFKTREQARSRAAAIRDMWRVDVQTPYEGQLKRAP
jgi:hypothetical protein